MRTVPIHELKRRLSELLAQVEAGTPLLIARHGRVVARLLPADAHLHVGSRFGAGVPATLLEGPTGGRYLDGVADDRRGGREDR